jgi:hypothetical protein
MIGGTAVANSPPSLVERAALNLPNQEMELALDKYIESLLHDAQPGQGFGCRSGCVTAIVEKALS